jgi:hypothetical protein
MRSAWWFVIAGVIALAGVAASLLYLGPRIIALDALFQRAVVPGSTLLVLDKPGYYTIYYERQDWSGGDMRPALAALQVVVVNEATGARLPVSKPSMEKEYSIGSSRAGASILGFSIDRPGRYRLTGGFADGRSEPRMTLTVEQGFFGATFSLIGITIAIAFTGLALAGVIVAITLWQRTKAKTA